MREIGYFIGFLVGTILKFAIPVGIVVLIILLVKRKKETKPTENEAEVEQAVDKRNPIYKKWWFWIIIVILIIAIIPTSNNGEGDEKQADETQTETSLEYLMISVTELVNDLEGNALNAKEQYEGKCVEISGRVDVIDASGEYICLYPENSEWSLLSVQCSIENKEQREFVKTISTGDIVTLRGKITSVGEVLGYYLDIHEFVE